MVGQIRFSAGATQVSRTGLSMVALLVVLALVDLSAAMITQYNNYKVRLERSRISSF